jgi:hypothetical protein
MSSHGRLRSTGEWDEYGRYGEKTSNSLHLAPIFTTKLAILTHLVLQMFIHDSDSREALRRSLAIQSVM